MCASRPLQRFLLVVLEHRRVRGSAPDDDVENRVQTRVAGERAPQLPLVHDERVRRLATPVEHARHRAPGFAGAANRRSRALRAP